MKYSILLSLIVFVACAKEKVNTSVVICNPDGPMEALDGRPTMLVVGDSISIGYTPTLKNQFPELQVIHNTCNARNSANGAARITSWVNHTNQWEVCTLNHGLHDITAGAYVPVEDYVENLRFEISELQTKCDKVIFATTTPVPAHEKHNRQNSDVIVYNAAALELMDELSIPVCDLNAVGSTIPHLYMDAADKTNVHFNKVGYRILGEAFTDCIRAL